MAKAYQFPQLSYDLRSMGCDPRSEQGAPLFMEHQWISNLKTWPAGVCLPARSQIRIQGGSWRQWDTRCQTTARSEAARSREACRRPAEEAASAGFIEGSLWARSPLLETLWDDSHNFYFYLSEGEWPLPGSLIEHSFFMPGALLGTREHTEFIHIGFILHGERKTETNCRRCQGYFSFIPFSEALWWQTHCLKTNVDRKIFEIKIITEFLF